MKIYQIEKTTGVWEYTWRTIVGTYLSKKKAESELAKLKAAVHDCDECPYSDEGQEAPINTTCPHHKPKYNDHPGYAPYYTCENNLDSYNTPSYKLLEFEVDETVDVTPVVNAHWTHLGGGLAKCSNCKWIFKDVYDQDNEDTFCRKCGAKMDESEE